ncbi:hypothetical protein NDU88_004576 [Pleurodeles waltl]|uniref:Uncharacterized protein n=1 Tax=Pleurodeles waltl TaxID=8319 RepID=A0AAV7VJN2_PLEWA|nr:hypothetical protein NDU88_004576 [Pleurodeles waltl]
MAAGSFSRIRGPRLSPLQLVLTGTEDHTFRRLGRLVGSPPLSGPAAAPATRADRQDPPQRAPPGRAKRSRSFTTGAEGTPPRLAARGRFPHLGRPPVLPASPLERVPAPEPEGPARAPRCCPRPGLPAADHSGITRAAAHRVRSSAPSDSLSLHPSGVLSVWAAASRGSQAPRPATAPGRHVSTFTPDPFRACLAYVGPSAAHSAGSTGSRVICSSHKDLWG